MKLMSAITLSSVLTVLVLSAPVKADDDDMREMKTLSEGLGLISLEEAKTKALEAKPG
ncbi:MAG: peptidase M4, partial [Methylophaga sp.]|nr:peptidase M4 [Methylophaga sp.]